MLQIRKFVADLKLEKWILWFFGFYPSGYSNLWSLARLSLTLTTLTLHKIPVFKSAIFGNVIDVTMSIPWPTDAASLLKAYTLIYYANSFLKIENILNKPILSTYPEEYSFIDKNMKLAKMGSTFFLVYVILSVSFFLYHEPVPLTKSNEHFSNDVFLHFIVGNNLLFVLYTVSFKYNLFASAVLAAATDCMFGKLAMISSCLFDVLNCNLRNIDYEHDKNAEMNLKENILRHIEILK